MATSTRGHACYLRWLILSNIELESPRLDIKILGLYDGISGSKTELILVRYTFAIKVRQILWKT